MLRAILNGGVITPDHSSIHIDDRGLLYGDGLFETMLLKNSNVRFLDDHLQRLRQGCEKLKIEMPEETLLRNEVRELIDGSQNAIVKLIVTRGRGGRGYRPSQNHPTRLWQLFAPPAPSNDPIAIRWCETRLSRNSLLAGIKHLNRLEQVLAQSEWSDTTVAEGLMLDTEYEVVCGTMSNVFIVIDNTLVTPDLRFCGVKGVMRCNVLRMARKLNIDIEERSMHPEEINEASEVFITNAVRGIQPVMKLIANNQTAVMAWPVGDITSRLMSCVGEM